MPSLPTENLRFYGKKIKEEFVVQGSATGGWADVFVAIPDLELAKGIRANLRKESEMHSLAGAEKRNFQIVRRTTVDTVEVSLRD